MQRLSAVSSAIGALVLGLAPVSVSAQPVLLTGDTTVDFVGDGVRIVADPAGVDVGVPVQFPAGTISGHDIQDIRLSYDAAADTLYVGFTTYRIAGDVDGDGDPGRTSATLAGIGGADLPDFGGTEAYALLIDIDEDGDFDVIAGVPASTDIQGFTVAEFSGSPFAPGFAFGPTLHDHVGAVYGSPTALEPHFQFTILRFSELLAAQGALDASASFGINAFAGSFGDAGIGEDFTPGVARTLDICLTPDAPETTCNGFDDDCDGAIDEDVPGLGDACTVGLGECRRPGFVMCGDGETVCGGLPGAPRAERCDTLDNDCDGAVDEDIAPIPSSCGVGACAASGERTCVGGVFVDDCTPGLARAEQCNAVDDDCDGRNDEGIAPIPSACGLGACAAAGERTCQGGRFVDDCNPGAPVAETCNATDDDCDGRSDEGIAPVATACGVGSCAAAGERTCQGGVLVDDCTPGVAAAETCNGDDDDCDGVTDEDIAPVATTCGVGACGASGERTCQGGRLVDDCSPGAPVAEVCNAIDDDCDGRLDERIPSVPTACGVGVCAAKGQQSCVGGELVDSCEPGAPGAETCNGLDDDCDGRVDEGIAPEAVMCGVGRCSAKGQRVCVDGALVDQCDPGAPRPETCNSGDDDCDGAVDEDLAPRPIACGVGACAADGEETCRGGRWVGECQPGAPVAEACNATDDDCDGRTDEGIASRPITCGVGACAAEGEESCEAGRWVGECLPGAPVAEACNATDDDCDGATDEGIAARPIECGVGACAADGEETCEDGRWQGECEPGAPVAETCNAIDDDCDGRVDEGIAVEVVRCGEGLCSAKGTRSCVDGELVEQCTPGEPAPERCNNGDDDCDGATDEGIAPRPIACGVGACAADGEETCRAGRWIGECQPGAPVAEACNATDDDCDGRTDEGIASRPIECGVGACAADGEESCEAGRWVGECHPGAPVAEVCDAIDNDCDGTADEGIAPEPTTCGAGACAARGERICADGERVDTCEPGAPTPETCDGLDNDCDGATDEGFGLGERCTVGAGACLSDGEIICAPDGGAACDAEPGAPVAEVCDAVDNDCDGNTDEGIDAIPSACGEGACAARGEIVCDGGRPVDTCQPGEPADELCNEVDDDCDGAIDEGTDGEAVYAANEYSANGHAIWLVDFARRGTTRMHFADDARFRVHADGTATLTGTAFVFDGPNPRGEEWAVDVSFVYRGQGPDFGGPKIERPNAQPPAITDLWHYYDVVEGTLTRPGSHVTITQAPADGRYPPQVGDRASGKDNDFGMSFWFDWVRRDADGSGCDGHGDFNLDLLPLDICAEPEVCNDEDDDRDGVIDEGFGLGEDCAVGVGACAAEGTVVCGPDGDAICDAEPGAPADELCNAIDDDCDGSADEGIEAIPTECGLGLCAAEGEDVCVDGEWVDTCLPGEPADELCNEVDDDCDGEVDEATDGEAIYAANEYAANGHAIWLVDFARRGTTRMHFADDARFRVHADGTATLTGTAFVFDGPNPRGEEWAVDVSFVYRGQGPDFGGPKIERPNAQPPAITDLWHYYDVVEGTLTRPGSHVTITQRPADGRYPPQVGDRASGKDNDFGMSFWFDWVRRDADGSGCDGHGDFNLDLLPLDICAEPEVCNDEDDDRDGVIDEGFGLGEDCVVGVGACAAEGTVVCGPDGDATCDAEPGAPADELCNAIDDDCDGRADEGIEAIPAECGVGVCAARGEEVCDGGAWVDTCEPGAPAEEVCNELDDDCDGAIDEFPGGEALYAADEYSAGGHAIWLVDFGVPGETRMHFRDDARFRVHADGTATLTGTAFVVGADQGGPGFGRIEEWDVDVSFVYRGQGPDFGGPKIERPGAQPPAITDLWHYYDVVEGTLTRPGSHVTITQAPADGRFPPQVGERANGKDDDLGMSFWFDWVRRDANGLGCEGHGDFNLDLDPLDLCAAEPEVCDGEDDDLDGAIDEDFDVGAPCEAGVGACHAVGETVCGPYGGVVCDVVPGVPAREVCDAVDNDCDGAVDEGIGPNPIECGVGACAARGEESCVDGEWVGDCRPGEPAREVCDAIDNDCDGATDEGIGPNPIECGVGACAARGEESCVDGEWVGDCRPGEPAREVCDAIDNDCDGATDEGIGPNPTACGVGACAARGEASCVDGGWADDCTPGEPSPEVCNGVDDDCDGATDEGIAPVPSACGVGACGAAGEVVCVDGALVDTCQPGEPGEETCDDTDEDCDGAVDEATRTYLADEYAAHGHALDGHQWGRNGGNVRMHFEDDARLVIADDGTARLTATAFVVNGDAPVGEQWHVDVSLTYRGRGDAFGGPKLERPELQPPEVYALWDYYDLVEGTVSRPGSTVTLTQRPADGRFPYQMGRAANNKDADFGASVWWFFHRVDDDGFESEGTGDFNIDLILLGDTGCYAEPEVCNDEDDDLDGAIDEGFGIGERCHVGVGACAADGSIVCGPDGATACSAEPGAPAPETCEGTDEDCDGAVDEDIAPVPSECGEGACAARGEVVCIDGCLVDTCEPGAPAAEECNLEDDDCDGATDEDIAAVPSACGEGACAARGEVVCIEGCLVDTCEPAPGRPEICNAVDDDCDGLADEDVAPVATVCGEGECSADGALVCDGGVMVDTCEPGPPADETCDGTDEDCDGLVDEGLASREWRVTEYHRGHALWLHGFNRDGHLVRMRFRDDATFLWHVDGTARILGTAYVYDLGGGPGALGQAWYTEFYLRYRGEGPEHGGPKIERPGVQTPAVTDTWNYWDIIGARLTRPEETVTFTQRPVDGSFPFQFGWLANGKDDTVGAAVWFDWHRETADGQSRSGHGDLNVTMHDEVEVCAEPPIDPVCENTCHEEGARHMAGCLRMGFPAAHCEALLEQWVDQCIMFQCC